VSDFFDFRTAPSHSNVKVTDYTSLSVGVTHQQMIFYGYTSERGSLRAMVTAHRDADGILNVTSDNDELTPVVDGEKLIGVRYPGAGS
jgi:hypothetical protein